MSLKAAFFDLDGTLINTIPDLADAVDAMRRELGLAPIGEQATARCVGQGAGIMIRRALEYTGETADAALLERAAASFRSHYDYFNGLRSKPYPGVIAGLDMFRAQMDKLAVVTNKTARFATPLLQQFNMTRYFDFVICGDSLPRRKPDPAQILHACEKLQVAPAEVLFIGDSANDALAAQAAGTRMLLVPYGYPDGDGIEHLPADGIVPSFVEAARWAAAQGA